MTKTCTTCGEISIPDSATQCPTRKCEGILRQETAIEVAFNAQIKQVSSGLRQPFTKDELDTWRNRGLTL